MVQLSAMHKVFSVPTVCLNYSRMHIVSDRTFAKVLLSETRIGLISELFM